MVSLQRLRPPEYPPVERAAPVAQTRNWRWRSRKRCEHSQRACITFEQTALGLNDLSYGEPVRGVWRPGLLDEIALKNPPKRRRVPVGLRHIEISLSCRQRLYSF